MSQVLWALCHDCQHKHPIIEKPERFGDAWLDWVVKHPKHRVEVAIGDNEGIIPDKFVNKYKDNADTKISYSSSGAYTITLASLATDSNLLAGRESTAIDNTSNKYLDYLVGGLITAGTSPTASKQIEVWAYGSVNDTPTYPDVLDGTDSNETITSTDIKNGALALLAVLGTDSTTNRGYWMKPTSLAAAFGGAVPKFHGLFVVHNMGVALNSTGGNHVLNYTPIYLSTA